MVVTLLFIASLILSLFSLLKANPFDSSISSEINHETIDELETKKQIPDSETCKPEENIESEQRTLDNNGEDELEDEEETNDIPEVPHKPSLFDKVKGNKHKDEDSSQEESEPIPCTCGVFLSGQFKKGSKKQPKGLPVLTQEMDTPFMNNAVGNRQCTNKCLELIIKHLPKSNEIICATVEREHVYKERAYLFVKNHSDKWHGTNLSAGREYCCRDYVSYKCPVG